MEWFGTEVNGVSGGKKGIWPILSSGRLDIDVPEGLIRVKWSSRIVTGRKVLVI